MHLHPHNLGARLNQEVRQERGRVIYGPEGTAGMDNTRTAVGFALSLLAAVPLWAFGQSFLAPIASVAAFCFGGTCLVLTVKGREAARMITRSGRTEHLWQMTQKQRRTGRPPRPRAWPAADGERLKGMYERLHRRDRRSGDDGDGRKRLRPAGRARLLAELGIVTLLTLGLLLTLGDRRIVPVGA